MPVNNKQKIVAILGPTASGKTDLSLALAKKYSAYIISADSRQIYKEMDIGTAKSPNRRENKKIKIPEYKGTIYNINSIPHFMIDVIEPNKSFSLFDWQKQSKKIIKKMSLNFPAKIPFLVGGTGLYISSLVDNYQLPDIKVSTVVRTTVRTKKHQELLQDLKKLDPFTYQHIDKKNPRRLMRALEFVLSTNKSFLNNQIQSPAPYSFLLLGIDKNRDNLYKDIERRVNKMIKDGLIEEIKYLSKKYGPDCPAFSAIGYKQIVDFLQGGCTKNVAIENIKKQTRHYAKRQLSWFRRDKRIQWVKNYNQAEKQIQNFLQK